VLVESIIKFLKGKIMTEELMAIYAKMKDLYPEAKTINFVFEIPTNKPKEEMFLHYNRDIDENHVRNLMEDISIRGQRVPGNINQEGKLTDCQHRYVACQRLDIPLKVILTDDSREDILGINQNQKSWNMEKYMNSFISMYEKDGMIKYADYLKFREFMRKTGHEINNALGLVLNTETMGKIYPNRNNIQKIFKDGELRVPEEDWKTSYEYSDRIAEIGKFNKEVSKKKVFILAYQKALNTKNFKHKRMLEKVKQSPYELRPCTTTEHYLEMFQGIYNRNLPVDNRVWLV